MDFVESMTQADLEAKMKALPEPEVKPEPEKTKQKKVAILGFTETWRLAPFDDPEFEIWGLNELYLSIPRWTRWFEIHKRSVYEADKKRTSDHVERLKQMTCPIYMHQHWDDIPNSVPYPLEQVGTLFPNPSPGWRPYLTNTISYMLALAICEGFEEIHVYGVDMSHDTEYGTQRPSCEYYVGIAQGRGIKVYIPDNADLLKTVFLYGYEEPEANGFDTKLKSRRAELEAKRQQLEKEINERQVALQQYYGAIQDCEHMLKNWRPVGHGSSGG